MKLKKLIVNADDFNLTQGVNDAILILAREGVISTVSAFVNLLFYPNSDISGVDIGLHFNVSLGKPVLEPSQVKTLVNNKGYFNTTNKFSCLKLNELEIDLEFEAQFRRFSEFYHQFPTHIDSHHHIHKNDNIYKILLAKSIKYNIPLRKRFLKKVKPKKLNYADYTKFRFDKDKCWDKKSLSKVLATLKEGVTELIVHPGFYDEKLKLKSSFLKGREVEYLALLDINFKSILDKNKITLIGFTNICNKLT